MSYRRPRLPLESHAGATLGMSILDRSNFQAGVAHGPSGRPGRIPKRSPQVPWRRNVPLLSARPTLGSDKVSRRCSGDVPAWANGPLASMLVSGPCPGLCPDCGPSVPVVAGATVVSRLVSGRSPGRCPAPRPGCGLGGHLGQIHQVSCLSTTTLGGQCQRRARNLSCRVRRTSAPPCLHAPPSVGARRSRIEKVSRLLAGVRA